jgi:hypothetical protein
MSVIKITVTKAEFLFFREAVNEKFNGWMEEMDDAEEEGNQPSTLTLNVQQVTAMKDAGIWKTAPPIVETLKKPHWTQTAKGRKIMANRKSRGKKK